MTDEEREAQIEKPYAKWTMEETVVRLRKVIEGQGLSMATMRRELNFARAEVAELHEQSAGRLDALNATQKQAGDYFAEITRLQEEIVSRARVFGQMSKELGRLQAPPGASAMEKAQQLIWYGPNTIEAMNANTERIARAIETAEREARAAELAACRQIAHEHHAPSVSRALSDRAQDKEHHRRAR